jgi:hypothetical protein
MGEAFTSAAGISIAAADAEMVGFLRIVESQLQALDSILGVMADRAAVEDHA